MTLAAINVANASPQDQQLDNFTALCKALADKLRLTILRLLKNESFGVLELCRILDIKQSALSHHLKVLANVTLVSTRREGNSIFYRRGLLAESDPFLDYKHALFDTIDQQPLTTNLVAGIQSIQNERAQLSLDFFNRNVDKFKEQQGLITNFSDFASTLDDLVKGLQLNQSARVMEVGPGEGELLRQLASQFDHIIALDNSPEMLDMARHTIAKAEMNNVSFVLGDTGVAKHQQLRCDLLIFNMVLHHISSPAETFADCAHILNPNGLLLVVDLCRHDQDWVRQGCGDLWLGFESEDLTHWAEKAELATGQSLYLGLRNGFQIQMRLFSKPNK